MFSRRIITPDASGRARDSPPDRQGEGYEMLEPRADNRRRAREKIYDIAYSNPWEWWVTLTLDGQKIERMEASELVKVWRVWAGNRVQRHGLHYLALLERHKVSGGIHLHALVYGDSGLGLVDSGIRKNGRKVYNVSAWPYGFSHAVRIGGRKGDNVERLSGYLTKYLTKDTEKIAGSYYWAGGKELVRERPVFYASEDFDSSIGTPYVVPNAGMFVKYYTYGYTPDGRAFIRTKKGVKVV